MKTSRLDETGKITVGEQAKASYLLAPEHTVIEVKRKIGTGEQIRLGKKTLTPAEISAEILKYVKTSSLCTERQKDSYFICTEARIGAETWEKL